jgi:hypothetical protein
VGALVAKLRSEPAAWWVTGLGTIAAIVTALAGLNSTQASILAGLATAAGTVITAFRARPWDVAAIAGAAGIVVQSLVIIGVHPTAAVTAAVVQAVSLALGLIAMRPNLTPIPAAAAPAGSSRM